MKLFKNKKLLLIISATLISLVMLVLLSISLYKSNEHSFVLDGYVISSSKKQFFNKNTNYKDSLDSKISFKNIKNSAVKVNNSDFIHYDNNSIGVFSDSYLLDLDNVEESLINYYILNKDDVVLNKENIYSLKKYSASFKNFLIFSDDNKFIVAGNQLKLSNNNELDNNFYEVTYKKENVTIQSSDETLEVDSSLVDIYVNDKIMIDLASKQVCKYTNEQKDCLYSLENIDKLNDDSGKINDNIIINDNETIDEQANNNISGIESSLEPKINLVYLNTTYNSVISNFEIIDPNHMINNDLKLTIVHRNSGNTIYEKTYSPSINFINLDLKDLMPNEEYLLTIKGSYNFLNKKYDKVFMQKLFETDSLNINIKKDYLFQDEIGIKINTSNTLINSFSIKINDENGNSPQNLITYICDNNGNNCETESYTSTIEIDCNKFRNGRILKFTGLESNKKYFIIASNYHIENKIYSDKYTIKLITTTLKEKPTMLQEGILKVNHKDGDVYSSITTNENKDSEEIITDKDNSIINYKYVLFSNKDGNKIREKEISRKSMTDLYITEYLKDDTNYELSLYAIYNDNEKNIELELLNSSLFNKDGTLYEIEFEEREKFYEHITGNIIVKSNTGPYSGYNYDSFYIKDSTGTIIKDIQINDKGRVENIVFDKLKAETKYNLTLYGKKGNISQSLGTFTIKTTSIPTITLEWDEDNYTPQKYAIDAEKIKYDEMKEYIEVAYIELIGAEKNIKSGNILDEFSKNIIENINMVKILGLECDNENENLYSCLEPGNYNIKVTLKDINGTILHQDERILLKGEPGTISVNEKKVDNKFVGYKITANTSNDGIFYVYDVKQCNLDNKENKDLLCDGDPIKSTQSKTKEEDFVFDNNSQYKKGNGFVFVFDDTQNKIYSDVYYPEKETPKIKLYPSISSEDGIKYKISIEDPDDALICDGCGIYYEYDGSSDVPLLPKDENGNILNANGNVLGEVIIKPKDETSLSQRYRIYYKASISSLYDSLKTETLLYDYIDLGDVSFKYDIKTWFSGTQILLKEPLNVDKIVGYKVNEDDEIKQSINDCTYDENKYYGCIFVESKEIEKVIALYDSGILGFDGDANLYLYQEQDSLKYLQIATKNEETKLIDKKDSALGLQLEKNIEFTSTNKGALFDNIYIKPKKISYIEVEPDKTIPSTEVKHNYIDIKNIKTTINSINIDYTTNFDLPEDKGIDIYLYTTKPSKVTKDNAIQEIKCNNNSCTISNLNVNTDYYFTIYYDNKAIYDYYNFEPIIYNAKTKDLDPKINFNWISGSGKDASRQIEVTITESEFFDDVELDSEIELYKCGNAYQIEEISKNEDTEETQVIISLNNNFIFDSEYTLKLKNNKEVIYEKNFIAPALKDIEFKNIITYERLQYIDENEVITSSPYIDLKIQHVIEDSDHILILGEDKKKYTVSLQECSSVDDNRCSTVVEQQKIISGETEKSDAPTTIFNNVKENTKYKISYLYSVYQPNIENIDIQKDQQKIENVERQFDQYIFINSSNEIISTGKIEIKLDNNYNNTNTEALLLLYYNSNNIDKIDEIVYNLYSGDNKVYTFTESKPIFEEKLTCSNGECQPIYYQNILGLDQFNLESSDYNLEISYRSNGQEVDRYSDKFEYESVIYIYKIEDLLELANLVNSGDDRSNYKYVLANSLDFTKTGDYYDSKSKKYGDINGNNKSESIIEELTTGSGFKPIGYYNYDDIESSKMFSGIFDGSNYTISNLRIERNNNNLSVGLFGAIKEAKIENLNIEGANIKGNPATGILVGYSNISNIKNVTVDGNLKSNRWAGGIVGHSKGALEHDSNISLCTNRASINSNYSAGGIVGSNQLCALKNNFSSGTIKGSERVGGIVGYNVNSLSILENNYSTALIKGYSQVGGIAGYNGSTSVIKNYSTASIEGNSQVGGIVGEITASNFRGNTYSGSISSTSQQPIDIGGLVGYAHGVNNETTDHHSADILSSSSSGTLDCSSATFCGGIVGRTNSSVQQVFSSMTILINDKGQDTQYVGGLVGGFQNYLDEEEESKTKDKTKNEKLTYSFYTGTIQVNGYSTSDNFVNGLGTLVGINGELDYKDIDPRDVTISKCYSLGNIMGKIKRSIGTGMIGINIFSIEKLYNGGIINTVGDGDFSSQSGAIIGSSGEYYVDYVNDERKILSDSQRLSQNNVITTENLKELKLHTIYQQNIMRNNYYSEEIVPIEKFKDENSWFKENWDEKNTCGDNPYPGIWECYFYYRPTNTYPNLKYEGYDLNLNDDKHNYITSNNILIE